MSTVFEALLDKTMPNSLIMVKRTTTSRHQFILLMRNVSRRISKKPVIVEYSKGIENTVKSTIEEHSLWGDAPLYVLVGFRSQFVKALQPPKGVFILAETTEGEIESTLWSQREIRNALRSLIQEVGLKDLKLSHLLKLDWSSHRSFEELEGTLRLIKLMNWGLEDLEKRFGEVQRLNLLELLKRGRYQELLELMEKYSASWLIRTIIKDLTILNQYSVLRRMGRDEKESAREVDLKWKRAEQMENVHRLYTPEEMLYLMDRVIKYDRLIRVGGEIVAAQFILGCELSPQ